MPLGCPGLTRGGFLYHGASLITGSSRRALAALLEASVSRTTAVVAKLVNATTRAQAQIGIWSVTVVTPRFGRIVSPAFIGIVRIGTVPFLIVPLEHLEFDAFVFFRNRLYGGPEWE
jgi:ABC-type Na+ efflux pump permease subunit